MARKSRERSNRVQLSADRDYTRLPSDDRIDPDLLTFTVDADSTTLSNSEAADAEWIARWGVD